MRRAALLIDCGTSRVKVAAWERGSATLLGSREAAAPMPVPAADGAVEIPAAGHPELIQALAGGLAASLDVRFDAAVLCSEMHGFLLADEAGRPLTPYISWRDERGARPGASGSPSTLETLAAELGGRFRAVTGMRMRSGLPFVTLCHLARGLPANARLLSLPEWIATATGRSHGTVHETMAAASGLYDLDAARWSEPLFARLEAAGAPTIAVNRPTMAIEEPIGEMLLDGRPVPLHAGVGDMQAAVLGAGTREGVSVCVNAGTGSQVSRILSGPSDGSAEVRPYFDGARLATFTHIPSGRAFRCFEAFFDSVAEATGGQPGAFWPMVAQLTEAEVEAAPLTVDLNVFSGAWRYAGGGSVSGIMEGALTPRTLVASLVRGYIAQYPEAIDRIDPDRRCSGIALAGGMPRRIPVLAALLARWSGRTVAGPGDEEEGLAGLARLAARLPGGAP